MMFSSPQVQNDLVEAACVNSLNEDCVALATIRRGMIEGRQRRSDQEQSKPITTKRSGNVSEDQSSQSLQGGLLSRINSSISLPFALPLGIGLSKLKVFFALLVL